METLRSELQFEDWKPPFVQFMLAQFALIMDQPRLFEEVRSTAAGKAPGVPLPAHASDGLLSSCALAVAVWTQVWLGQGDMYACCMCTN